MPNAKKLSSIGKVVMEFDLEEISSRLAEIKEALENEEWAGSDIDVVTLILPHDNEHYMRALGKAMILLEQAYGESK